MLAFLLHCTFVLLPWPTDVTAGLARTATRALVLRLTGVSAEQSEPPVEVARGRNRAVVAHVICRIDDLSCVESEVRTERVGDRIEVRTSGGRCRSADQNDRAAVGNEFLEGGEFRVSE